MRLRDRVARGSLSNLESSSPARLLIGGVGYRWQRDASFGLVASDALSDMDWPPGVEVADLGYGAIYVSQDIAGADPPYEKLILLAGVERGRDPGQVYIYPWQSASLDQEELQARIREAGAGVIDLDHLLSIAQYFKALPEDVLLLEVEPVDTDGGEGLSPEVENLLPQVIEFVRKQVLSR
jgi:hydrogenase maturation protease